MKIGDFAKVADVSIRTLRHWDKAGLLRPAGVNAATGYRTYDIDALELVFDCGDEGLFHAGERRVQNMLAMAAAAGEPMYTALPMAQWAALLERHGFLIYEHLPPKDVQRRYFAGCTDGL